MTAALGDEKVWALHQDVDGGIWIGTRAHGLYRYRNDQLSHFTTANGWPATVSIPFSKIRRAISGSAVLGVMLLNRAELDAQAIDRNSFSRCASFAPMRAASHTVLWGTQPAGAMTGSGEAWFPTSQGCGAFAR